ncbi:hypothetical protein ACFQ8O_23980 [Streptomyces coelicoflavus]|uniref:hypothetical protein n=1 Tax=Streptomyces coelicoflavus TaxID=285562 RepID=UPI003687CE34
MDEAEARARAEEFARSTIKRWDEWRCELRLWEPPKLVGSYGYSWRPTTLDSQGRPVRVGGNFPILVDRDTGECRRVRGVEEYRKLSGK